jgi:hypothetical protein
MRHTLTTHNGLSAGLVISERQDGFYIGSEQPSPL